MLERLNRNTKREPVEHAPHEGKESELHERIMDYCRSKGWQFIHSRTDKPSTNQLGCPDFLIAANDGVTFWIECKRKGSKPTTHQLGTILALKLLGHRAGIIFSFQEFLDFVNTKGGDAS